MMKIVALLQNMWVLPRSLQTVAQHPPVSDQRERLIHYALFAGCLTGRRLKAALGEELCEAIVWQEANPTVATDAKKYFPPDREHLRAVLAKHQPDVVVCFTKAGEATIREVMPPEIKFVPCVHPACRHESTMTKLRELRTLLTPEQLR